MKRIILTESDKEEIKKLHGIEKSRVRHLMENIFGKKLLTENKLRFEENLKIRIFQSIFNYSEINLDLDIDGIAGTNTIKAINTLIKSDEGQYYFPNGFTNEGLVKYYSGELSILKNDSSNLKQLSSSHNVAMLQTILCLAGKEKVIPDGVIGTITRTAMREKFGTEDIKSVKNDVLAKVISEAITNVKDSYLLFKVDGVDKTTTNKNDNQKKTSEKDNRNKLFHAALDMLIDKVISASPYPTFGQFKTTGIGYNVYNVQETYIAYLPPNKEFKDIAKSEGFVDGGCWWYDKIYTKKIYFYKCGAGSNYRKKFRHYDSNLEKESYSYSKK